MSYTCSTCGHNFELRENGFPFCPHCVQGNLAGTWGIVHRHTPPGARAIGSGKSFISDAVNGQAIFEYMRDGPLTGASGCLIATAILHGTISAISHKPLGATPGSGIGPSGEYAADFAVLYDVEGRTNTKAHFAFYTPAQLFTEIGKGDFVIWPFCNVCSKIQVPPPGGACPNCQLSPP